MFQCCVSSSLSCCRHPRKRGDFCLTRKTPRNTMTAIADAPNKNESHARTDTEWVECLLRQGGGGGYEYSSNARWIHCWTPQAVQRARKLPVPVTSLSLMDTYFQSTSTFHDLITVLAQRKEFKKLRFKIKHLQDLEVIARQFKQGQLEKLQIEIDFANSYKQTNKFNNWQSTCNIGSKYQLTHCYYEVLQKIHVNLRSACAH